MAHDLVCFRKIIKNNRSKKTETFLKKKSNKTSLNIIFHFYVSKLQHANVLLNLYIFSIFPVFSHHKTLVYYNIKFYLKTNLV